MENIRFFFNKVSDCLDRYEEVIETHHSLYGYPAFDNIDYFDICDIIYKIAGKSSVSCPLKPSDSAPLC